MRYKAKSRTALKALQVIYLEEKRMKKINLNNTALAFAFYLPC